LKSAHPLIKKIAHLCAKLITADAHCLLLTAAWSHSLKIVMQKIFKRALFFPIPIAISNSKHKSATMKHEHL
jgi:hypothetical protein